MYIPTDVQDEQARPTLMDIAEFKENWTGDAILLARKFSLKEAGKKFGVTWFLPVMGRFKKLFGEVLISSFFLQSFGLITPLFSQVIIDKVLVHKGLSTLDILVVGIFIINVFEWLLGFLRSVKFLFNDFDFVFKTLKLRLKFRGIFGCSKFV